MPALPIYKGIPGPTLLAELLLNKYEYEYHLPFYRQVKMLGHMGLHVKDNTVNGWFAPAASLLTPLYDALLEEILKSDYVQSDETTVPVIDHGKKKTVKEWLWGLRAVVERLVLFHYSNGSRGGKVIGEKAKGYKGYMSVTVLLATRRPSRQTLACASWPAWRTSAANLRKPWVRTRPLHSWS